MTIAVDLGRKATKQTNKLVVIIIKKIFSDHFSQTVQKEMPRYAAFHFNLLFAGLPIKRFLTLSVSNHISVPIGQISLIIGIKYKYYELSISYKFSQN